MRIFALLGVVGYLLVAVLSAQNASKAKSDPTLVEYFSSLPDSYVTARGDFPRPTAETLVSDARNGYAAAYVVYPPRRDMDDEEHPTFEMAVFKSDTKSPLLVVTNTKSDPVCTEHESFFLRRKADKWSEVAREVLPPLDLRMFWTDRRAAARFSQIVKRDVPTTYHFEPPRNGTRLTVSLEICDPILEETPIKHSDELEKLMRTTRSIYLNWNRWDGNFYLAK